MPKPTKRKTDNQPVLFDKEATLICDRYPNLLIPWFLMSSFTYEKLDASIISDACYDALSQKLFESFDTLQHVHKKYIVWDRLSTKGSSIFVDFIRLPNITKDTAKSLLFKINHHGNEKLL